MPPEPDLPNTTSFSDKEEVISAIDEEKRNIFDESGFPEEVVNSMCRANIPKTGIFEKEYDKKCFQVRFSRSDLQDIPIVQNKTGSRLGGRWTAFFRSHLAEVNKYCIWRFKRNRFKKDYSRKPNQGKLFNGEAE